MSDLPKGISRFNDNGRCPGWSAKVEWRTKPTRRFFSDKMHGGTDCAREKAISWLKEEHVRRGKPFTGKYLRPNMLQHS